MQLRPPLAAIDSKWRIDAAELEMGRRVGKGAFGVVYKAMWRGTSVAVKQIHATALETAGPSIGRIGAIKDWSDDDTEPGDDEGFAAPDVQRIINSPGKLDE